MDEVTLESCALEPIHIPGTIQSHGTLLAFDATGRLAFLSDNTENLLGARCTLGADIHSQPLPPAVREQISNWFKAPESSFESIDLLMAGKNLDVIAHRNSAGLLIVEFEVRPNPDISVASFTLTAHRAIERIMRQKNIEDLLDLAAAEVRKITGFDRVMAYRFRHDDSGEVVRESRREDLEDWEGRRYPSGDIPLQARRLYVLNKLRLIADAASSDIAVHSLPGIAMAPLDMSFSTLRSVSPIHIEYLTNMGVAASLSISVVVDGRLWGMIACHHMEAHLVPYGVRMTCMVIGQLLSVTIAGLEAAALSQRALRSGEVLSAIGLRARTADDLLSSVAANSPNPADLITADATLCLWGGETKLCRGTVAPDVIKALALALEPLVTEEVRSASVGTTHPALAAAIAPFSGIFAVCFDVSHRGWVVWLRAEQVEQVRWAGKPGKVTRQGPRGLRLTPRGSFVEWIENVRGSCVPWDRGEIVAAHTLRAELSLVAGAHAIEMERVRLGLLAALGHDLREPLHSISLAAQALQKQPLEGLRLGARIQSSSSRMSRLITQILDMSMLQSTSGISLEQNEFDLVTLLRDVVGEARFSYPNLEVIIAAPERLMIGGDHDRLSQVLSNLLSNARHHGSPGTVITVFAGINGARVRFGVSNYGKAIPQEERSGLFAAFKPASSHNPRNRTGLGLGLYIANGIVKAHDGHLWLDCEDGVVTFTADIRNFC